jgi:dihydropteroate synthase
VTRLPGLEAVPTGRCLVVGVVNVTPDSFSDGGEFLDASAAVAHGRRLLAEGADLLDVGGESTRPGAARVDVDEELRRVLPVVRDLVAAGALVSIDTSRAAVAETALDAGAVVVNDVTAGVADPDMAKLVAARGCTYVAMHSRGPSVDMAQRAVYAHVVADVRSELLERVADLVAAGVDHAQLVLDPGIGFAKNAEHSWQLLAALPELVRDLGRPLLVGTSRKSFLGALLEGRAVDGRDDATQATTALVATAGAWAVRVHAVRPAADAVRVAAAITGARP